MSHVEVGQLVFDSRHDPGLEEAWRADPDAVMERYGFTDEEREAIRAKNIQFFYELGVNPYLIGRVGQLMGLGQTEVRAALADAAPHPLLPTVWFPGPARNGDYLIRQNG